MRARSMRGRCACRVNLAGVADHSAELEAMNLACPTEFTPADRIAFRTQPPDGKVLCNVFAAEAIALDEASKEVARLLNK